MFGKSRAVWHSLATNSAVAVESSIMLSQTIQLPIKQFACCNPPRWQLQSQNYQLTEAIVLHVIGCTTASWLMYKFTHNMYRQAVSWHCMLHVPPSCLTTWQKGQIWWPQVKHGPCRIAASKYGCCAPSVCQTYTVKRCCLANTTLKTARYFPLHCCASVKHAAMICTPHPLTS